MIMIEESRSLEDTNLNKLGDDIAILDVFVVSDKLNKCLGQMLPIFVGLGLGHYGHIVPEFAVRSYFDQKVQSVF